MGETKWKKRNLKKTPEVESFTSKMPDTTPYNMSTAPLQTVYDNPVKDEPEGFTCNTSGIKSIKNKVSIVMDFLEKWFTQFLEYGLIKGPTLIINELTDRICGEVTPKEKDLVRTHIKEFFATLLACYITYNWYYVMFYPRKLLPRPLLKISTDRLLNKNKWISLVFKYLIVPMSFMNSILVNKIPFVLHPMDNKSKFLFLFYFIPKIILKHGAEIARGFLDSIRSKKTKRTGIFIAMMVFFGITSILRIRLSMNYFSELFRFFTQISMYFIPIFVVFVLRILFSSFHAWISGILVFGYLLVMSFFAMNIYGKTTNPLSIVYQINLQLYHKKPKRPPKPCDHNYYDEGGCTPKPFSVRITEFYKNACDFLFKYKFEVTFLVFFINSFRNYIYNLNDGNMKMYLVVLTFFGICLCFFSFAYRQFYLKKDYEAEYVAQLKVKCDEAIQMFGEAPEWLDCPKEEDEPKSSVFERIKKVVMGEDVSDSEDDEKVMNKGMINTAISHILGKPGEASGPSLLSSGPSLLSSGPSLLSKFLPKKKPHETVVNSEQTIVKSYVPVQQIVYTTDPAFSLNAATDQGANPVVPVVPTVQGLNQVVPVVPAVPANPVVQGANPVVQGTAPVVPVVPIVQGTGPVVQGTVLGANPVVQGTVLGANPIVQGTNPVVQRTNPVVQGTNSLLSVTPSVQGMVQGQVKPPVKTQNKRFL